MTDQRQPASQPPADEATRRAVLLAAARLLGYPDPALWELLPEIAAYLREAPASDAGAILLAATQRLRETGLAALEARYVATFDFSEPTSLYLTAHELGDSRRRGQAMVELRRLLRAGGFEQATGDLPDYVPLLLEFAAHAPAGAPVVELERRLAAVCERIRSHLDAENQYHGIFVALRETLPAPEEPEKPEEPERPEPERRFPLREQADTGEMPYPLRYE